MMRNGIENWEELNAAISGKYATFEEYEAAKLEIIGGVEYSEETMFPNQYGNASKQYGTKNNGSFFQITDPNTGVTEFWSTKHPESRYYRREEAAA